MARSHALAFFLARGLLEIGAGEGAPFTPPSFEAIANTIAAVRSDAGHLFRSIQNRNPYSAEERARLIQALRDVDQELRNPVSTGPEDSPAAAIPELEAPEGPERDTPELLAELDGELLGLLARRALLQARLPVGSRGLDREALERAATEADIATDLVEDLARLLGED
jgi:prephenate dehydrogenase